MATLRRLKLRYYWWFHPILWQRWVIDRLRRDVHRRLPWNYCDHNDLHQMVGPYVMCHKCGRIWVFAPHEGNV